MDCWCETLQLLRFARPPQQGQTASTSMPQKQKPRMKWLNSNGCETYMAVLDLPLSFSQAKPVSFLNPPNLRSQSLVRDSANMLKMSRSSCWTLGTRRSGPSRRLQSTSPWSLQLQDAHSGSMRPSNTASSTSKSIKTNQDIYCHWTGPVVQERHSAPPDWRYVDGTGSWQAKHDS